MSNQVTTLRPNGTVTTTSWALTGAATVHQALSDNSDSSFVGLSGTRSDWDGNQTYWGFSLSSISGFGASTQIRGLQVRVRAKEDLASNQTAGVWLDFNIGGIVNGGYIYVVGDAVAREYTGIYQAIDNVDAVTFSGWPVTKVGARDFWAQTHIYIFEAYLDIFYNEAPSPGTPTINGSNSTVNQVQITNLQPTIAWTYSDPEGDIQERYRIKIFRGTDVTGGGFNPATSGLAVYDSGEVLSTSTSHTLPAGALSPDTAYYAYVMVSDVGSNGRYSTPLHGDPSWISEVSFYVDVPTLLMPHLQLRAYGSNNPAVGGVSMDPNKGGHIDNIRVKPRINLLDTQPANFEYAGAGSTGGWGLQTGASFAGSTVYPYHGSGHARITADGSGSGHCVIGCNAVGGTYGWRSGFILTYLIHVRCATANRRGATLTAAFYDANNNLMSDFLYTAQSTTVNSTYKKIWLMAPIPYGAASTRMFIDVGPCAAGEAIDVDCASITPDTLNLLENPSFEFQSSFWTFTGAGGIVLDSNGEYSAGEYAVELTQFIMGSSSTVEPGRPNGDFVYLSHLEGIKFMTTGLVKAAGATTAYYGFYTNTGSYYPSLATTLTGITSSYQRRTQVVDASGISNTVDLAPFYSTNSAEGAHEVWLDDLSVEPLWVLQNGNMESGSNGANLPLTVKLGMSGGDHPHGWFTLIPSGGSSFSQYDNTQHHGGSLSLKIRDGDGGFGQWVTQLFTVSGWATIPLSFWYITSGSGTFSAYVEQFDSGGLRLTSDLVATASGTNMTWSQSSSALAVHPQAAYARLIFISLRSSGNFDSWVDDVVITPPSTNVGTYWLDGGWSPGGYLNNSSSIFLQRSPTGGNDESWTFVRPFQFSATKASPVNTFEGFSNTFDGAQYDDYEWPLVPADQASQVFYYRPLLWGYNADSGYVPSAWGRREAVGSAATVNPTSVPLRINEWYLIDVLVNANNYKLNVKSFKAQTDETAQTFTPAGRNRRVVVGDQVLGDHITLEVYTFTNTDWENIQKVINQQNTLLLRSPDGHQWWVRPVKRSRQRNWTGKYVESALRTVTIEFEEVDPVA